MEKDDKGSTMIRMGVSGWMFLLVPAYPGCPGSKAVKRSSTWLKATELDLIMPIQWLGARYVGHIWCVVWYCGSQSDPKTPNIGPSCAWKKAVVPSMMCHRPSIFSRFITFSAIAFSALTLLVGRQEGHPACKNWAVRCWCGYLSGVRCRLACGPADATATHCLLLQ